MELRPPTPEDAGLADPIYARICQRIRADILSGVFPPGQRLKVAELTKRYGVSQMPIREALQQLQGEWLVTILPNRGASVRRVDDAFISQMYEIRGHLESLLTRRCTERASDDDLERIRSAHRQWEQAARAVGPASAMQANWELHRAIYQVAGNVVGMELLQRHFGLLQSLRSIHGFGEDRLRLVTEEHRQLVDAICARDLDAAEAAARVHCDSARDDLLNCMHLSSAQT